MSFELINPIPHLESPEQRHVVGEGVGRELLLADLALLLQGRIGRKEERIPEINGKFEMLISLQFKSFPCIHL